MKKILSSLSLFVLLFVAGAFIFAKESHAESLAVAPKTIVCTDGKPTEVTFTASGLDPGGRYRIRFYHNDEDRPVVDTQVVANTTMTVVRKIGIVGECTGGNPDLASATYEVRLHKDLDPGPGEDWNRDPGNGATVTGVKVGTGGGDTGGGTGSPAPLWYDQDFGEWQAKVYARGNEQEIFGERYTVAQVQWVVYALVHQIMNMTGHGEIFACINDPGNSSNIDDACGDAVKGALDELNAGGDGSISSGDMSSGSVLATLFEPRAISFVTYAQGVGTRLVNLHLVPEAYAQQTGFGFTAFNPVQKLWRQIRNATYLLLVVVIIAMAFMIMFRTKINPQTVISVQSALPKVIVALILITFSYAIAGLLVDLMYVVIGILSAILTAGGPDRISTFSWPEMFGAMTNDRGALSLIFYYFFSFILMFIIIMISILGPAGVVAGSLGTGGTVAVIFIVFLLILLLFLLITAIRILWLLIRTYVIILLLVIAAPIQILAGTISPSAGFGSWMKNMISNLAVYPVVSVLFVISFVFMSGATGPVFRAIPGRGLENAILPYQVADAIDADTTWTPPLTGSFNDADALLWLMASFAVIMLIPRAGEMITGIISKRGFAAGAAIGASMGQLGGFAKSYGGFASKQVGEGRLPVPFIEAARRQVWDPTLAAGTPGSGNRFQRWTSERAKALGKHGGNARWWPW